MDNPFSWDYMTTAPGPNEVWGPFAVVYVILFAAVLVASIAIAAGWARRLTSDVVLYRMARRWANWGIGISAAALFFFAIRWLQINPFTFGERIWMWLALIALAALGIYAIYDYRAHYEALATQYQARQVKERYLKQASARTKHGAVTIPAPPPRPVRRRR